MPISLQLDHLAFVVLVLLSLLQGFLSWQVAFLRETEIADEFRVHLKELFYQKWEQTAIIAEAYANL